MRCLPVNLTRPIDKQALWLRTEGSHRNSNIGRDGWARLAGEGVGAAAVGWRDRLLNVAPVRFSALVAL
jgi:hypothetical protein